jgi:hypothetical protein
VAELDLAEPNRTLLVVGYGSLLSGYGLLAERRGGRSRLVAREAEPVLIRNARRGLAKPSSHGSYLAMDIEPLHARAPITAGSASSANSTNSARSDAGTRAGAIGGLLLTFDREQAANIARREEYDPAAFERLVALADDARQPLGGYLLAIARATNFDLLAYRGALRERLGYTSPGYIFHPLPLDDGRVAVVAVGSGFDGSGDPSVRSRRHETGMDRLLGIGEALALDRLQIEREGQLGYFVECLLGGLHGIAVGDLIADLDATSELAREIAARLGAVAIGEHQRFLSATSLEAVRYRERCGRSSDPSLAALLKLAGLDTGANQRSD